MANVKQDLEARTSRVLPDLLLVVMLVVCSEALPAARSNAIIHDDLTRTFRLFVPANLRVPAPLVLVLHGGGGSGARMERYTGFNVVADREGFVVAYPDGYEGHWNDGRMATGYSAHSRNIDDVGFIAALIERVKTLHSIDAAHIYVAGASNGGMMTHRLAGELTGTFAAAAPVIANIPAPLLPLLHPTLPIPMLIINGTEDPLVPWGGGDVRLMRRTLGVVASVETTVDFWVAHNGCQPTKEKEWLPDADPKDGTRIWKVVYPGGLERSEVILYGIEGGGHTWPGRAQYLPQRIIGRVSRDMNATEVIWQFFARHSRSQTFSDRIGVHLQKS